MIRLEHIAKKFGRLPALSSIDLELKKGQCVALIGPNGSGKTTLIKTILGMVIPDQGQIYFNGEKVLGTVRYRQELGYMPQIGRYPDNMSIGQIFDLMRDIRGVEKTDDELYHIFRLDSMKEKKMRTLSGGTRQKVSASLAFLFHPSVLILDEPTAGLDPLSAEQLKQKIRKEINAGKLILITSHILSDLDELVTEVVYIQEGKLVFHENYEKLKEKTGAGKLSRIIAELMIHEHE